MKLLVLIPFHAWGRDFAKDEVFDQEDTLQWPEDTLANRLNNGWVKWVADPAPAPEPPKPPKDPEPPKFASMTKEQLLGWALETYGEELDGKKTKAELIEECTALLQKPTA